MEKDLSKRILRLIKEHRIDEAKILCQQYPNNEKMQLDLMIILFMEGKGKQGKEREELFEEAKKIERKFPNSIKI